MHFKEINVKNRVYNYFFDNAIIKRNGKIILITEKKYKDSVVYFARYNNGKSIKM